MNEKNMKDTEMTKGRHKGCWREKEKINMHFFLK